MIADAQVINAISEAYKVHRNEIQKSMREFGDLGEVAEKFSSGY